MAEANFFKKIFKKGIDKIKPICYNDIVRKGMTTMTEREKRIMEILKLINGRENPTWEDETEKYYLERELAEIRAKRGSNYDELDED